PATTLHPNSSTVSIGDYGKLVALLGKAFDGTGQAGSTLPVVYDEFGVQSVIPPEKASLYTGTEQTALTRPVPEETQSLYYTQAVQLAFCEPTVEAFFVFHSVDETNLAAWQSGLYYPDGTPKTSLAATRLAFQEAHRGVVARCPGLKLTPKPVARLRGGTLSLSSDLDARYVAQLFELPGHLVTTLRGQLTGGAKATSLAVPKHGPTGKYRIRLTVQAAMNAGPSAVVILPLP
ncbi:MAG: hypothetical protein JO073_01550, partial [Actinobacteria bacterium]|nr:hypothetical protein [Actinomycetota bacterium]